MVETATKEAVAAGMDTKLRDSIIEGVEQETVMPVKGTRRGPTAAAALAACFVAGYLIGRRMS